MANLEDFYQKLKVKNSLTPEIVMDTLFEIFGGTRVSVSTIKQLTALERNEKIRGKFHGGNYEELAIRFRISPRQVRRIVHGK